MARRNRRRWRDSRSSVRRICAETVSGFGELMVGANEEDVEDNEEEDDENDEDEGDEDGEPERSVHAIDVEMHVEGHDGFEMHTEYLDEVLDDRSADEESHDSLGRFDTCELGLLHFLASTTQSASALDMFFRWHRSPNSAEMRRFLDKDDDVTSVNVCGQCAEDLERCECDQSTPAEIVFLNANSKIRQIMAHVGESLIRTQDSILNGASSSSPMAQPGLRPLLQSVDRPNVRIHFSVCWDGIRLKGNCRKKCWIFSALPLDLPDNKRENVRLVFPLCVYIGLTDPNYKIHDRVAQSISSSMAVPTPWNGYYVTGYIATACHDDPARRRVYNMRGSSSAGACFFCFSPGTMRKYCDAHTHARTSQPAPPGVSDGLNERGNNSWFNSLVPVQETPIDVFHALCEGVFPLLICEVLGAPSLSVFKETRKDPLETIRLPTHMGECRNTRRERTGSENTSVFETAVVFHAYAGRMPPVASVIVLFAHCVWRMMVDKKSINDVDLGNKVSDLVEAVRPLILEQCPEFVSGPKRHQILFHLVDNIRRFGPLGPLSTRAHEHSFHTMQRNLCPEITRGVGQSLLSNSSQIHQIIGSVVRRLRQETEQVGRISEDLETLATDLLLLPKKRKPTKWRETPEEFEPVCRSTDLYAESQYIEGRLYSTRPSNKQDNSNVSFRHNGYVQFGIVRGFLLHHDDSRSVLIKPYVLSSSGIDKLAIAMLSSGIAQDRTQSIINVFNKTEYGSVVKTALAGHTKRPVYGSTVRVSLDNLIGHSVLVKGTEEFVVLPMGTRTALS